MGFVCSDRECLGTGKTSFGGGGDGGIVAVGRKREGDEDGRFSVCEAREARLEKCEVVFCLLPGSDDVMIGLLGFRSVQGTSVGCSFRSLRYHWCGREMEFLAGYPSLRCGCAG